MASVEPQDFTGIAEVQRQQVQSLHPKCLVLFVQKPGITAPTGPEDVLGGAIEHGSNGVLPVDDAITRTLISTKSLNRYQFGIEIDGPPFWEVDPAEIEERFKCLVELAYQTRRTPRILSQVTEVSRSDGGDKIILSPFHHWVHPHMFIGNEPSAEFQSGEEQKAFGVQHSNLTMEWQLRPSHFSTHDIIVNPTFGQIRELLHDGQCPAACKDGWLPGIDYLPGGGGAVAFLPFEAEERRSQIVRAAVFARKYRPVCPLCVGGRWTKEHWTIFAQVRLRTIFADRAHLSNFIIHLNTAREAAGYTPYEFNSKDWFDDLRVERKLQYEHIQPEVYLALPRVRFQTTERWRKQPLSSCDKCEEPLYADTIVMKLACGHMYCVRGQDEDEESCITKWLKEENRCFRCHLKLSYGIPFPKPA